MNKTPVKETARQAGPHMAPIHPNYPIASTVPAPGQNYWPNSTGTFTVRGPYENSVVRVEVDLVLSVAGSNAFPATTRVIPGGTASLDGTNWSYTFTIQFPVYPGDDKRPAALIIRGNTTDGTVMLYVPFSCTPPAGKPPR
jgi:hypothetical protein